MSHFHFLSRSQLPMCKMSAATFTLQTTQVVLKTETDRMCEVTLKIQNVLYMWFSIINKNRFVNSHNCISFFTHFSLFKGQGRLLCLSILSTSLLLIN